MAGIVEQDAGGLGYSRSSPDPLWLALAMAVTGHNLTDAAQRNTAA